MESIIKWKTGQPKEEGEYLVVVHGKRVEVDQLYACDEINGNRVEKVFVWNENWLRTVTAWCKLSDIEPYKE